MAMRRKRLDPPSPGCGVASTARRLHHPDRPQARGYNSIVPSNTNSAGPVSVTLRNWLPLLSNPTINSLPPRTSTPIVPETFSVAAKISALATTPVPQASVSSSTPRSYVRSAIFFGPRFSRKFTFAPFGANISCRRIFSPLLRTSTTSMRETETTTCGTPLLM